MSYLLQRNSRNPAVRTYMRTRKTKHGSLSIGMNGGDASAPLRVVLNGEKIETPWPNTGAVGHDLDEALALIMEWLDREGR